MSAHCIAKYEVVTAMPFDAHDSCALAKSLQFKDADNMINKMLFVLCTPQESNLLSLNTSTEICSIHALHKCHTACHLRGDNYGFGNLDSLQSYAVAPNVM